MAFSVKTNSVWKNVRSVFVNQSSVWKPVKELWVNQSGVWKRTFRDKIEIVQASNDQDVVLRNKAIAAGADMTIPLKVEYTINSGVVVYGSIQGGHALDLSGFPNGTIITVTNNGVIGGRGGNGGNGGSFNTPGSPGQNGSHGVLVDTNVTITTYIVNNGLIAGGGGGGGGGGGNRSYRTVVSNGQQNFVNETRSGGSGGAGGGGPFFGVPGGVVYGIYHADNGAFDWQLDPITQPVAGAIMVGGGPSYVMLWYTNTVPPYSRVDGNSSRGGAGGYGGDYGQAGTAGGNGSGYLDTLFYAGSVIQPTAGGPGGQPGNYITNNSRATWLVTGDRRGFIG